MTEIKTCSCGLPLADQSHEKCNSCTWDLPRAADLHKPQTTAQKVWQLRKRKREIMDELDRVSAELDGLLMYGE